MTTETIHAVLRSHNNLALKLCRINQEEATKVNMRKNFKRVLNCTFSRSHLVDDVANYLAEVWLVIPTHEVRAYIMRELIAYDLID